LLPEYFTCRLKSQQRKIPTGPNRIYFYNFTIFELKKKNDNLAVKDPKDLYEKNYRFIFLAKKREREYSHPRLRINFILQLNCANALTTFTIFQVHPVLKSLLEGTRNFLGGHGA